MSRQSGVIEGQTGQTEATEQNWQSWDDAVGQRQALHHSRRPRFVLGRSLYLLNLLDALFPNAHHPPLSLLLVCRAEGDKQSEKQKHLAKVDRSDIVRSNDTRTIDGHVATRLSYGPRPFSTQDSGKFMVVVPH